MELGHPDDVLKRAHLPGYGVRPGVYGSVDQLYEKTAMVGEGTYGKVYKAVHRDTGMTVALKRVRIETEREGFPITGLREIKILTSLRHTNVIQLLQIISEEQKGQSYVHLVFEYMDHDLTGVFNNPNLKWEPQHIKCLMQQLFDGLSYLHSKGIVHRDMKGSNLLLNKDGILKLADFGLARSLSPQRMDYTNRVITLWYRPPELLLGSTQYGVEIDLWSAGCIMAEMLLKKPIFPGVDEISQLEQIWKICGTPTEEVWPGVTELPWWAMLRPKQEYPRCLKDITRRLILGEGFKLLDSLLNLNPIHRPTAIDSLHHPYFTSELPEACKPYELPKVEGDWHEYESKQRKKGKPANQPPSSEQDNAGSTQQLFGSTTTLQLGPVVEDDRNWEQQPHIPAEQRERLSYSPYGGRSPREYPIHSSSISRQSSGFYYNQEQWDQRSNFEAQQGAQRPIPYDGRPGVERSLSPKARRRLSQDPGPLPPSDARTETIRSRPTANPEAPMRNYSELKSVDAPQRGRRNSQDEGLRAPPTRDRREANPRIPPSKPLSRKRPLSVSRSRSRSFSRSPRSRRRPRSHSRDRRRLPPPRGRSRGSSVSSRSSGSLDHYSPPRRRTRRGGRYRSSSERSITSRSRSRSRPPQSRRRSFSRSRSRSRVRRRRMRSRSRSRSRSRFDRRRRSGQYSRSRSSSRSYSSRSPTPRSRSRPPQRSGDGGSRRASPPRNSSSVRGISHALPRKPDVPSRRTPSSAVLDSSKESIVPASKDTASKLVLPGAKLLPPKPVETSVPTSLIDHVDHHVIWSKKKTKQ
ncbi:kinase subunit of RNA polymerase II carboxy-terminal domain kinase I [Chytridiales sp. JEL 0842]|nr:kinase subunit of RNA polymerase II carboxy-terminal domain kinase I [Chytridiales sp. JEL 0842]